MKSLLPQGAYAPHVYPRPRKRLARCTLDCGFQTAESPALRGFVGGSQALATAALYLVLKSNGLHRPKIRLKKFGFSSKSVPANIAKKLPSQRCSQPLFNFAHKWPTSAFTGESGYTLGFRRKIAHKGLHAEAGAFPLQSQCGFVLPAKFLLFHRAFIYIHFPVLCSPSLSAEEKKSAKMPPQLCPQPFLIAFSTSRTNGPRSLSWAKVSTRSAFGERSHTAAYTPKQGAFRMGVVSLPSIRAARSRISPGRVSERRTLPLLGLGRGCSRRSQKACGTAMRLCVSLSRGIAAPLGCVICLQLGDVAVFSLCAQYFLIVRGGGGITTLSALCVLLKRRTAACQKGSFAAF